MRRHGGLAHRSVTEWAIRGVLAAVALAIAYVSVAHTLAYAIRNDSPERAQALSFGDGRIIAVLARKLTGVDAAGTDRVRADRLARAALRQDSTAEIAASTLGIITQAQGNTAGARRLFAYAERLSRRDIQTQIWAIEDAVGRGNVPDALRHYDIALRTSRTAPDLLFPVLGSAIIDPTIRTALTATLAGNPAWGGPFIDYVAGNGTDSQATMDLFLELRRAGVPVSKDANATVISTLVSRGLVDTAWRYYSSVRGVADRRRSRDPNFAANVGTPSPFDWRPLNEGGISASIQRADRGGILDFSVPASVGGPLLQQIQILPPGVYLLDGHSAGIDQSEDTRPYWALTCVDGRELGRVTMPSPTSPNGGFAGRFTVPAGCPVQTLALVAQPVDAAAGITGQVDRVRLYPAP
jgi:hypothetical protein